MGSGMVAGARPGHNAAMNDSAPQSVSHAALFSQGPISALGTMTGTSLDGLDVALVRIEREPSQASNDLPHKGMQVSLIDARSFSLGGLATRLRLIAEGTAVPASEFAAVSKAFGDLHARSMAEVAGDHAVTLAGVHGQTVFHRPPLSLQLLEPAPIAETLGCPVWFNPRQADLASGGQGAPVTPLADLVLYGSATESRAIINLGGFCNVTRLEAGTDRDAIRGFDVCACNQLLDGLARLRLNMPYDDNGDAATKGSVDERAAADVRERLAGQHAESRSLGSGDEAVHSINMDLEHLSAEDALATAAEALGSVIAEACAGIDRLVLAGGGARNRALASAITKASSAPVDHASEHGIDGVWREAAAMAVLATLSASGERIALPGVTGRAATGCVPDGNWAGLNPAGPFHS